MGDVPAALLGPIAEAALQAGGALEYLPNFEQNGFAMDVVFFTNYELQVQTLINSHLEIAWNSPLAWVDTQRLSRGACRAIAMRDTDRDRCSHIIAKNTSGIGSPADLKGKTIGLAKKLEGSIQRYNVKAKEGAAK